MAEIVNVEGDMIESRRREMTELVKSLTRHPDNRYPQNLARAVKEMCDQEYGGNWNCHVGPSFGR